MFKSKMIAFIGALAFSSLSFAFQNKPEACPKVTSIQAKGMSATKLMASGDYTVSTLDNYDTSSAWLFMIGPINTKSYKEALTQGNQIFTTIYGSPYPKKLNGDWVCLYNTINKDHIALALWANMDISPLKMSQYLRKNH